MVILCRGVGPGISWARFKSRAGKPLGLEQGWVSTWALMTAPGMTTLLCFMRKEENFEKTYICLCMFFYTHINSNWECSLTLVLLPPSSSSFHTSGQWSSTSKQVTHISTSSQDSSGFPYPSCQSQLQIPFLRSALQFTLDTGLLFPFLLIVPPSHSF